jgi:hypothetical protein
MSSGPRLALLAVLAVALPAFADHVPGLTDDEEKCQQITGKVHAKLQASLVKCLVKCDKAAAQGKNPDSDCAPPYGGATLDCLAKANTKAAAAPVKKCAPDCPECYMSGDCAAYDQLLRNLVNGSVNSGVPQIACDDSGSGDGLTVPERECRQAVALQASKVGQKAAKCFSKCRAKEAAGTLPPGTCTPATLGDPATQACLDTALLKCVLKSEKKCPDPPECLGDVFFPCQGPINVVSGFDALVFCAN